MPDTLYVLYACDNNYAPYTGISMNSLFENNREIPRICVFLVADKVSAENQSRLLAQAGRFRRELVLIDASPIVDEIKALGLPAYRGSYTTNFRMFFHIFLPNTVDRLLYLDSDTLVTGSLSPLLSLDMEGKPVAVVRESLTSNYILDIGLDRSTAYFNAGVTLIDVAAWGRHQVTERLLHHIRGVRARYCNPDQDLLNLVLRDDKYLLPPAYNFQPVHRAFSDEVYFSIYRLPYYSHEELEEARMRPRILHTYRFLGDFPWNADNAHPDTALFDFYCSRSPWQGYEKKRAERGPLFALEKLLYRILPKRIFLKIFATVTLRHFRRQNRALEKARQAKK